MNRKEQERAWIRARKLKLVGSILAASDQELFIEATFESHFGCYFRQKEFWKPFEQACCAVFEGKPWSMERQLMLALSLPQEINAKDPRGEAMLTLAAANGRAKVVNILCQIKADPKIENAKGWSTVHVAAAYNHTEVLKVLLALGVSVNEPDSRLGYTPLHLAASVDNVEVLECLHASAKADFTKRARNGFTILHVASSHGSKRCVKFLIDAFPDLKYQSDAILNESPAHKAAKHLHPQIYTQLVQHGARDDLENVQVRGTTLASDRARRRLRDARRGVRISVPQPRASLTPDQPVTRDAPAPVRSRVLAFPERLALALFTRAASAAGAKLIDQVHVVARLPKHKHRPKALALDGLLEPAVLPLAPIPDRDGRV